MIKSKPLLSIYYKRRKINLRETKPGHPWIVYIIDKLIIIVSQNVTSHSTSCILIVLLCFSLKLSGCKYPKILFK